MRDATYVLDEILDNETELTILEHTTDTAGYTEVVFALFDLLGLQFSPKVVRSRPRDPDANRPARPAAVTIGYIGRNGKVHNSVPGGPA